MSDDSNDDGATIFNFPRTGFRLTPTATLPTTLDPDPSTPGDSTPDTAPGTGGRRGRRSPLDTLNALAEPGLTVPQFVLPPAPAPGLPPAPGYLPDTFRTAPAGGDDPLGPGLGALSIAAVLAVAVAALRGTATFLQDRRQRRLARDTQTSALREARMKQRLAAEEAAGKHTLAMQGLRDKQAQQRTKNRVPSSNEYGRKSLTSHSGSGKSGTGSGSGRPKNSTSGTSHRNNSRTGPDSISRKKPSDRRTPNGSGTGPGGGRKNGRGPGAGGPDSTKKAADRTNHQIKQKGPHRGSQGAGSLDLKKNHNAKHNGGRTTLPQALKNDTHKAAANRLDRRRKDLNSPAVWSAGPNGGGKGPKPKPQKQQKNGSGGGGAGSGSGSGTVPRQQPVNSAQNTSGGASLWKAAKGDTQKAAARRWKQRQKNNTNTPPVWGAGPKKVNFKKKPKKTPASAGASTPKGTNTDGGRKRRAGGSKTKARQSAWQRVRSRVTNSGCFPGATSAGTTNGNGTNPNGTQGNQPPPDGWASWEQYQEYLHAAHNHRMGYDRQDRKSPFQNAGQAQGATHNVERDDYPGAQAKRWEPDALTKGQPMLPATGPAALDAAPGTHPARPGTSRPKEAIPMPPTPTPVRLDPRIVKARKQAARTGKQMSGPGLTMDAQHETEITLDDAIDEYDEFAADAFKTHDQCFKLAGRARKLRNILLIFAVDLAVNHNLIGPLISGAMARLAESMDLIARMADEMEISSLQAAEQAETADNDLNDAYRPYNVATADAGLSTPSAPIHNNT